MAIFRRSVPTRTDLREYFLDPAVLLGMGESFIFLFATRGTARVKLGRGESLAMHWHLCSDFRGAPERRADTREAQLPRPEERGQPALRC